MKLTDSIPKTESDTELAEMGYNLLEECDYLISKADFSRLDIVLDLATGTGRAVSLLTLKRNIIITGDYNNQIFAACSSRIKRKLQNKVTFIRLNLEVLPFPDNSFNNIVCLNTIHELEKPELCLYELFRVFSGKGKMLIADFTSLGLDVMDQVHLKINGKTHNRGLILPDDFPALISKYTTFYEKHICQLNQGFIINGKM